MPTKKDTEADAFAAERHCPACGKAHASSFVSPGEVEQLEGLKLSLLPVATSYRVFYCGGAFHAVAHEEGAKA